MALILTSVSYAQPDGCQYRIRERPAGTVTGGWGWVNECKSVGQEFTYNCEMVDVANFYNGPVLFPIGVNNYHVWRFRGATAYKSDVSGWINVDPNDLVEIMFGKDVQPNMPTDEFKTLTIRWGAVGVHYLELKANAIGNCTQGFAQCTSSGGQSVGNCDSQRSDWFKDYYNIYVTNLPNGVLASTRALNLPAVGNAYRLGCTNTGSFEVTLDDNLGGNADISNITWSTNNPAWSIPNPHGRTATVYINDYSSGGVVFCSANVRCGNSNISGVTLVVDQNTINKPISLSIPDYQNIVRDVTEPIIRYNTNPYHPFTVHLVEPTPNPQAPAYLKTEFQIEQFSPDSKVRFGGDQADITTGRKTKERFEGNVLIDPNGSPEGSSFRMRARHLSTCGASNYTPWLTVFINSCPVENVTTPNTVLCNPGIFEVFANLKTPTNPLMTCAPTNPNAKFEWTIVPSLSEDQANLPTLIDGQNQRVTTTRTGNSSIFVEALNAKFPFTIRCLALYPNAGTTALTGSEPKSVTVTPNGLPTKEELNFKVTYTRSSMKEDCSGYEHLADLSVTPPNASNLLFGWSNIQGRWTPDQSNYFQYSPNPVVASNNANSSHITLRFNETSTSNPQKFFSDIKRIMASVSVFNPSTGCINSFTYAVSAQDPGPGIDIQTNQSYEWWQAYEERMECSWMNGARVTSLEDLTKSSIIAYPNPNKVGEAFTVKGTASAIKGIHATSVLGAEIKTTHTTNQFTLLTSTPGLYFVKIKTSDNHVYTQKLIVE